MNFNQLWNGNRGRNRGNRGPVRGWRGGHFRGGPHYHRGGPPLLNSDSYYGPNRFRGPPENYSHFYSHPPNQNDQSWTPRPRHPFASNPRQNFLPNLPAQQQIPNRSASPLPGTEEYMQRNISEKSAFLKRELELDGPCFNTDSPKASEDFDSNFQTDSTNNNFCENTYPKEYEEEKTTQGLSESSAQSPRRNKKQQRPVSQRVMSVEEIHEKIINHISNLSHNKKINLVNLSGPSGYDIAIQEITRQKRMELSKALRDMCHNKFKETENSSDVINAIIPDFDIKIEELPRELVEQLSSTLNENVTERINMCIDPELMFQQAAEMLNTTLDIDKNIEFEEGKTDCSYTDFSNKDEVTVESLEPENSTVNVTNDESVKETSEIDPTLEPPIKETSPTDYPALEPPPMDAIEFDLSDPSEFNIPSPNKLIEPSSSPIESPSIQEPTDEGITESINNDCGNETYSPDHKSSNCSNQENSNMSDINFDLMNIPEPNDPLPAIFPSTRESVESDIATAEAELTACLAQNDLDLNVLNLNTRDKISFNLNKRTLLKRDDFREESSHSDVTMEEEKSSVEKNIKPQSEKPEEIKQSSEPSKHDKLGEKQKESETVEEEKIDEKSKGKEKVRKESEKKKDDPLKKKSPNVTKQPVETKEKKKEEDLAVKKNIKNKKDKAKLKQDESCKDDEMDKKKQEKKSKSRHDEESLQKSLEKDDRSERRQQSRDRYITEPSKTYDDDVLDRRKDKKFKNKYDEEYYNAKYERSKFDAYQGQSYEDTYKKRYRDSPILDEDKHRRADRDKSFERYRDLESDTYHYSKYPDIEDGRTSKRYYHDKSSYRQEYEYPYNKYDYSNAEYYQRTESYPAEEYDQKAHYSKMHKSKKKHSKKHKRHRDHSSDSHVSSSGSEKNSTTSSNFKSSKHTSKQSDLCDSAEEVTTRHPKTSLMERLQVLCDTKLRTIKPEPISPNHENITAQKQISKEPDTVMDKNVELSTDKVVENIEAPQQDNLESDKVVKKKLETVLQKDKPNKTKETVTPNLTDTKNRSESEEDLKNASEIEIFGAKKYRQRPWKSPGEKKFMMEHLNQNPTNDEDFESEYKNNDSNLNESIIQNVATEKTSETNDKGNAISEIKCLDGKVGTSEHSTEVSSSSDPQKLANLELKPVALVQNPIPLPKNDVPLANVVIKAKEYVDKDDKMLVTTYTQTEHKYISTKEEEMKKDEEKVSKALENLVKPKEVSTAFTQTITISTINIQSQTDNIIPDKVKMTQTDHVNIVDKVTEPSITNDEILPPLKCNQFIERMFQIDEEIDKLIKLRQNFYRLLNSTTDLDGMDVATIKDVGASKVLGDSKDVGTNTEVVDNDIGPKTVSSEPKSSNTSATSKLISKIQEPKNVKSARNTPDCTNSKISNITERASSRKKTLPTSEPKSNKPSRSAAEHNTKSSKYESSTKISTPEPTKPKSAHSYKEKSKKIDVKPNSNIPEKQKPTKLSEQQKPAKSSEPQKPVKPNEPQKPAKATEPQKPIKSSEVQKPIKPSEPQKPTKTVEPQKPTKPPESQKSTKPNEPQKLTKPNESQKHEKKEPETVEVKNIDNVVDATTKQRASKNRSKKNQTNQPPPKVAAIIEKPKSPKVVKEEQSPLDEKNQSPLKSNLKDKSNTNRKRKIKEDAVKPVQNEQIPGKRQKKLEPVVENSQVEVNPKVIDENEKVIEVEPEPSTVESEKDTKVSDDKESNLEAQSIPITKPDENESSVVEEPALKENKDMQNETVEVNVDLGNKTDPDLKLNGNTIDESSEVKATEETLPIETPETPVIEPSETPVMETSQTTVIETPETPIMETSETPVIETPGTPVIETSETPVIETSETPVNEENKAASESPEATTHKKKKRRLSGIMAEYRTKKKKSKKSKRKHDISDLSKFVSVKSSVKIARFSMQQLEEMREDIRSKQLGESEMNNTEEEPLIVKNKSEINNMEEEPFTANESLVPNLEVESDPPITNVDESIDSVDKDVDESNAELEADKKIEVETFSDSEKSQSEANLDVAETSLHENDNLTGYTIDFKNFTGAILVIKVIKDTVLAASDKGKIFCFNILDGELIQTIDISKLAVTSLVIAFRNESHIIYAGCLDSRLTILDFQTKEILKQETLSEPVQCIEYSWDFIFVGSDRGSLIRFDLNMEKVVDELRISNFNILMIKASQEGPRKVLVVATRNSPVCIRDALSGLLLRTMQTSFSPTVYTLLIDKNFVYCGTSQHGILVYTFEDGQLALQHEATKSKGVVCMQIVGNRLFAGCYNGNIYVYNTNTNDCLGTMSGPGGLMLSMEIIEDKIIVGTKSSNFKAWKIPEQYYDKI